VAIHSGTGDVLESSSRIAAELTDELAGVAPDVEAVLSRAVEVLSRARSGTWVALVLNSDPSTSYVVSADHDHPRMASYVDAYMASLVRRRTVPTTGMSQLVIDSGEAKLIPAVPVDRMFDFTTPASRRWYESNPPPFAVATVGTIVAPMRAFGQVIGTLQLAQWNAPNPLSPPDVEWLQTIADRLGLLVEHAQCHAAALARLDRLTSIRNVSLALASSQDLRLTLHLILEQLVARLGVHAADLLQVDRVAKELRTSASVGFHSGWAGDSRIQITNELADSGASGRRFELRSDPLWLGSGRRSLFAREGFTSYRAVPLMARTQLLGVLEVFARADLNVDEEWTGFLHAMAISAAVAIDNANLHEQAERGFSPLRALVQRPELTGIEWRILALVVEGATNREIADSVHLSENTIKFHIRRLLDRLSAVNRTDLARKATQNSWL
jgi:DNA-binding CsgD family transcriptional regulator